MPSFSIVDTHVRFWDKDQVPIPWTANVRALNRPFGPDDLTLHADPVEIEAIVFVEADVAPGAHLREAEWVSGLAVEDPRIQAIVAHAPLEKGAGVAADLEALAAMPLVRGVRRLIQHEPDPAFCLQPGFVEGVKLLPRFDLHFEICIFHPQFESALALVRQCPEVQFVLDHIAKPGIKDGLMEPWATHMTALAECENVVCKLSGVATEADHEEWSDADLRPYMDHALGCFGSDRVMFGGDWPVATLAIDYPRWVGLVEDAMAGASETERRRVFRDNGIAAYRLG